MIATSCDSQGDASQRAKTVCAQFCVCSFACAVLFQQHACHHACLTSCIRVQLILVNKPQGMTHYL